LQQVFVCLKKLKNIVLSFIAIAATFLNRKSH